jgi:hypothetical protein
MKTCTTAVLLLLWSLLLPSHAETLYGPGSISIATNEAILITTLGGGDPMMDIYVDGQQCSPDTMSLDRGFRYAIGGAHTVTVSNNIYLTFQRLQGSSIKTIVLTNSGGLPGGVTNFFYIPAGKTVQFFHPLAYMSSLQGYIHPEGSGNTYTLFSMMSSSDYPHPSICGPVIVEVSGLGVVSYYLTDEILQLPPQGFLQTPAPALEVNVEKSYNLTNWTPVGAFNTSAETGAFYRLKILK